MNAIDEVCHTLGVTRRRGESDLVLSHRLLLELSHLYRRANPTGWVYDREGNNHTREFGDYVGCVDRDTEAKVWRYFVALKGKKPVCEGYTSNLETALQVCSLAMNPCS
jgi:hypothetical protein